MMLESWNELAFVRTRKSIPAHIHKAYDPVFYLVSENMRDISSL
jgi:hypothetical protein